MTTNSIPSTQAAARQRVTAASRAFDSGWQDGGAATALALALALIAYRAVGWPFIGATIAERMMELTPVEWSVAFINYIDTVGKPLAVFGAVCVLMLLGALAGGCVARLEERRGRRALVVGGLAAGAALAALGALFSPPDLRHAGLSLLLFGPALAGLRRVAPTPVPDERRWFLKRSAQNFAALVGLSMLSSAPTVWRSLVPDASVAEPLFTFEPPAPRLPDFDLAGMVPEVTPVRDFYVMSKSVQDPRIVAEEWTLRVGGLVDRPLRLSLDDLAALGAESQWTTLRCVSNWVGGHLMSNGLFTGVSLARILQDAGVRPGAVDVVFHARDGYSESLPLDFAQTPDVLVAYGLNGQRLERRHGFPARLLAPGVYGFKNVKWLDSIEIVDYDYKGRWQQLGWVEMPWVKTIARIDVARLDGDLVRVGGVAFAGRRGVQAVEVRLNGGPWQASRLHSPPLSNLTWIQWRVDIPRSEIVTPADQKLTIEARATDGTGAVQTDVAQGQFPDGASGYHSMAVEL